MKIDQILIALIRNIIKICKYIYNFYQIIFFLIKYNYFKNNISEEEVYKLGVFFSKNRITFNQGWEILEKFGTNSNFYRKAQFYLGCSLFNNSLNCPKKNFSNFFINNRKISENILNFFPPQINNTLISENFNLDNAISKIINDKPTNSLSDIKQIKIYKYYQSEHNLHYNQDFYSVKNFIESYLNNNLKNFYFNKDIIGKFVINKMWFVKSSKGINLASHNHPEGVISGILYYKIPTGKNPGYLIIENPQGNIIINSNLHNFKKDKKIILIKPEYNNLIIFNSYLNHSVVNQQTDDWRISIPWDADFII